MFEVKSPVPPLVLRLSSSLSVKSFYSLLQGIILHVTLFSYRVEDISGNSGKNELCS